MRTRSHIYDLATARGLLSVIAASCALAFVSPPRAEAYDAAASQGVSMTESGIVRCANKNRQREGLAPLRVEGSLGRAARLHARNEVRHGFFSHFDHLGRGPAERVGIFDSRAWGIGENLVYNASSASQACRLWMGSAGHRTNILDPAYTHIGAGFAGGRSGNPAHYVQVFGVLYDQESL